MRPLPCLFFSLSFLSVVGGALSACGGKLQPEDGASPGSGTRGTGSIEPDRLAEQRSACGFHEGARPTDTLPLTEAARAAIPIRHVIVMMKENRSFDHLLGRLHDGKPDVEAIPPRFTNHDAKGASVTPFHQTSTCISHDPAHQWDAMHEQVDDGRMDGFVKSAASSTSTDGDFAMGYYDRADIPFYYWLATTYAIDDRHFASVRSGTYPNRNFLLLGTNDGVKSTGGGYPSPTTPTIFGALDKAGVSWGVFSDGELLGGTFGWDPGHAGTGSMQELLTKLDDGTLPQVTFVDGVENVTDDHPTADVQAGEAWTRSLYERVTASPLWSSTALIWMYDEGGGFADHVPPPHAACVARAGATDRPYVELGVRVPLVVISPYARAGYTSHVVQEHTAVTRFIETVFDLPALTARDANSDALLDLFDFASPPAFLNPPPAPMPGTGGCAQVQALTVASPTFKSGAPITITFEAGAAGAADDWIGVVPYKAGVPKTPSASLGWRFIGGTDSPTGAPETGAVVIDASVVGKRQWPLRPGAYMAHYVHADGSSSATVEFHVVP